MDGEIGYAAGSEDDDLISLAADSHQADELGVTCDDELQIPADATSDLTGSSVQCQHVRRRSARRALPLSDVRHRAAADSAGWTLTTAAGVPAVSVKDSVATGRLP